MQMGPLSLRLVIFWLRKGNDFTLKTSPIPSRPPQPPSCSLSLSIVQHAVILCFHACLFLHPRPVLYLLLPHFSTENTQYASTDKTRRRKRDQDHLFLWKKCQNLTTTWPESALGPDLSLSGAMCHFSVTSGLLSGETRSSGERKGRVCGVSEIETQTWRSSIKPRRPTEPHLACHIKPSLSNTSVHVPQITAGAALGGGRVRRSCKWFRKSR